MLKDNLVESVKIYYKGSVKIYPWQYKMLAALGSKESNEGIKRALSHKWHTDVLPR